MTRPSIDQQPILAIESTCDETAAALIYRDGRIGADALASQESLHEEFAGVVPEIAARAHLERILPIVDHVLRSANVAPDSIAAIAIANEPGLAGSLLVGLAAAKAFALSWQKPLIALNHIHAHIYACQMGRPTSIYPCVGFIVSGGHTNLYDCLAPSQLNYLGGTIDDAAGEAFDKVGAMLGLDFPGGPALSRLAATGDPNAYSFPRPMLKKKSTLNLSFSGLKTAVRYEIFGNGAQTIDQPTVDRSTFADIAASFEAAVVESIVGKAVLAMEQTQRNRLCVGGGVAANLRLRQALSEASSARGFELLIAPNELCTDNAIMGAIAWDSFDRNQFSDLTLDAHPGLRRGK